MEDDGYLERIDAKLGALLALEADRVLKENNADGAGSRSVERLLADAGLGTAEIASLLGKGQRAVQKALKKRSAPAKSSTSATRRGR